MRTLSVYTHITLATAALTAHPGVTLGSGDDSHREKARAIITKGVGFLKAHQDAGGGWSIPAPTDQKAGPHLPAISGLALTALLMDEHVNSTDPAVQSGVRYLLNYRQPDGGIYDTILPSYNTSICLSTLSKVDLPQARAAIAPAQEFLRSLQWCEDTKPGLGGTEAGTPVSPEHVFYGGIGYGKHGRPDNSNLNMMLQAFQDSGVSADDKAVRRALTFLQRTQMLDSVNDMKYADGSRQGGFVYATVPNAADASVAGGVGQSFAGEIEETLDDGTKVSRLRCYGSMTYAGFKSYVYANLAHDDPRVAAAYGWIQSHYTLDENPGAGTDGLYYYYVTFARALDSYGPATLDVIPSGGAAPVKHDWADDLIDKLATLQSEDGSFRSVDDRWMESDPVLITAYSLIALGHAIDADDKLGTK